jgi:hypothetical protein
MFLAVLGALGLTEKAKTKTPASFTDEEWTRIEASFKEKYGSTFQEALSAHLRAEDLAAERAQALGLINEALNALPPSSATEDTSTGVSSSTASGAAPTATTATDDVSAGENTGGAGSPDILHGINRIVGAMENAARDNAALRRNLVMLTPQAAPDMPAATAIRLIGIDGPGTTPTHLFGIAHPLFDMKKRWNIISANPAHAGLYQADEDVDGDAFRHEVREYGKSVAARYHHLQNAKHLHAEKLSAGEFANDLTHLKDAGLGDQYVVLRQDALIARIITLQNVYDLYPRRYGIQDRELMTNAFFSEISQAYQPGEVWKGDMELQPEMGHVDDAMAKIKFGPMKELERKYIGYLNTDGSDPIKWGMIEWQLLQIYTLMVTEQNRRRIRGCYIKPETGVPGSYLNTSTGLLYTLIRYMHENTLLPHSDASYNDYTETTFLGAVQEFVKDVKKSLDEDLDLEGFSVYLNRNHRDWWIENCRQKYGKDMDFTGPGSYANILPDSAIPIRWVPNMGKTRLIHIQEPGNLQSLEFVPGEMLAFKLQEFMEQVMAWSTWKEGFTATFIGKHFTTPALLKANNYSLQRVFCNKPAKTLTDGATAAAADEGDFWFLSAANTAATALTDIAGARKGIVYIIECGSATNATTIAKAAKFASITSAYTPTAEGDYIMVALNNAGTFQELERTVGGVRAINKDLQPNIPGAR